jgi:hypothetical protein
VTVSLGELEHRLEREPENLPLRVAVAGELRAANRPDAAVEHYRKVAIAYRSQGRAQQALAVCKDILELAPDDIAIHALVADLEARVTPPDEPDDGVDVEFSDPGDELPLRDAEPIAPMRMSATFETETPLPKPIPYHIADPTSAKARLSVEDVDENIETRPGPDPRAGMNTNEPSPDLAQELETREHIRISAADLGRISQQPPTVPIEHVDRDEEDTPTPIRAWADNLNGAGLSDEDDLTMPLEKLATAPIANAFFGALPAPRREAALARCIARNITAGAPVIRLGESGHPLILVVRGQLEVRHERPNGGPESSIVSLDTIEAGQFIGEASLLARTPAPATIVATTDSEVLALPAHALFELAGAYPALWAALKDSAERRTRQYEKILRSQST